MNSKECLYFVQRRGELVIARNCFENDDELLRVVMILKERYALPVRVVNSLLLDQERVVCAK